MFRQALIHILARLETARQQNLVEGFALIGGFAVSAWGVPRATQDIDFAIAIGSTNPHSLAAFLGGRFDRGEPEDPLNGVFHSSIQVGSASVSLQLIVFPSVLTEMIFRHIETISVMDQMLPVVSWQMLVLLKLYAGGPQDQLDAQHILQVRSPEPKDLQTMGRMAKSLGILEDWSALVNLYQR
ncbi:MAG: nucleotidyl transferase AbiEii/AbiGii toxin family protein [Nitrospirales bacterium]|nr:nucleotidyl transferase AbiEii/AbiGii toxin family protein [Nitrospirales bacterium]